MQPWLLIIVLPSLGGLDSMSFREMTEAQCRATLVVMAPAVGSIGLACVGPDGTIVEFGK
jgi:hypothetical protein